MFLPACLSASATFDLVVFRIAFAFALHLTEFGISLLHFFHIITITGREALGLEHSGG
jgi:hypothetical protein